MGNLSYYGKALSLTSVFTLISIFAIKYFFMDEYFPWITSFETSTHEWGNATQSSPVARTTESTNSMEKTTHATELFRSVNANPVPSTATTRNNDAEKQKPPLVAMWQLPFGKRGYGPGQGEHCGCEYTYNRSRLMESDAVVLYCRDADKSNLPPDFPNRTASQLYVWWCLEPPTHLKNWKIDLSYRRGFFNWTMTVRRDSDIKVPWGFIDDVKSTLKKRNIPIERIVKDKNRTAIAIASNCGYGYGAGKARLKMFKEMLERGLDMDTYGMCFQQERMDQEELFRRLKYYKFHMSFENSYHCRDYVTEKFWMKAICEGLVPVVWGARREDYEAIAPNSSFIFVEDFDSIDKLVKYLQFLDKNDTAYSQYFNWRSLNNLKNFTHVERDPPISSDFVNGCELCRHLLKRRDIKNSSVSVVDSIEDFYYDPNDKDCLRIPAQNETYWKYAT